MLIYFIEKISCLINVFYVIGIIFCILLYMNLIIRKFEFVFIVWLKLIYKCFKELIRKSIDKIYKNC